MRFSDDDDRLPVLDPHPDRRSALDHVLFPSARAFLPRPELAAAQGGVLYQRDPSGPRVHRAPGLPDFGQPVLDARVLRPDPGPVRPREGFQGAAEQLGAINSWMRP